jgi:hypothetical protein
MPRLKFLSALVASITTACPVDIARFITLAGSLSASTTLQFSRVLPNCDRLAK